MSNRSQSYTQQDQEQETKQSIYTKSFKFFNKKELIIPSTSKSKRPTPLNDHNSFLNHGSYIHIKTSQSNDSVSLKKSPGGNKISQTQISQQQDLQDIEKQWNMYNMMKRSLCDSYKRIELETMPLTTTTLATATSTLPKSSKSVVFASRFAYPHQKKPEITQENERKARYFSLKKIFDAKLLEQKNAINRYLSGEPSDPKIISSHKELMKVRPLSASVMQGSAKAFKPQKFSTNNNNNLLSTQSTARVMTQTGYRRPMTSKQQLQMHYQQVSASNKNATSQQRVPLMLYSSQNIFSGSKQKPIDPMKQKLKEFLDKFMKGEQEYFKKLNDVQQLGEGKFEHDIVLNQKFYKDYYSKPDQEFFQDSDLTIRKNCLIIEGNKFSQQYEKNKQQREQAYQISQRRISVLQPFTKANFERDSKRNNTINLAQSTKNKIMQSTGSSGLLDVKKYNNILQTQVQGLNQLKEGLADLQSRLNRKNNFTEVQEKFFKMTKENCYEYLEHYLNTEDNDILSVQDSFGLTPLHWAAKRGYIDIVNLFLLKNSPILLQDIQGKIAKDYAIMNKFQKIATILNREEQLLIKKQEAIKQQLLLQQQQTIIQTKLELESDHESNYDD